MACTIAEPCVGTKGRPDPGSRWRSGTVFVPLRTVAPLAGRAAAQTPPIDVVSRVGR